MIQNLSEFYETDLEIEGFAIYPDMGQELTPQLNIGPRYTSVQIPFDGEIFSKTGASSINIFVKGEIKGCLDRFFEEPITPGETGIYFFNQTSDANETYRIEIKNPSHDVLIHCDIPNLIEKVGYTRRAIGIRLDGVLNKSTQIPTETPTIGRPANSLEVGFPFEIFDARIIQGVESQYRPPTQIDSMHNGHQRGASLPLLGPDRGRVDGRKHPILVAEWFDRNASENKETMLLLIGVLLGLWGTALFEWITSLQRRSSN